MTSLIHILISLPFLAAAIFCGREARSSWANYNKDGHYHFWSISRYVLLGIAICIAVAQ